MKRSKNIIVGIDFSENAINALKHAISIAQKADAKIIMVWVNKTDDMKGIYPSDADLILSGAQHQFEVLIENYRHRLKNDQLRYEIRNGKVYKEIVNAADDHDAFLIVVGTHGASGFEKFWIGSNANRIVTSTERPIITIRGGVDINRTLSKIVVPIDSTDETTQKIPMVVQFARYFDSEIHLLATHLSNDEQKRNATNKHIANVIDYLKNIGVKFSIDEVTTHNIADATIEYAETINSNLICIMDEQERKASNFLLGPFAQQLVNKSPIPVLTISAKII
ncbi:MAG: universal stress protein [Lentimicrobiaceae bacterium]|jgi:nucleotide-binding universal stress UspA family protein|nr:universal stress protein [Lentimicrobiaceae bacterium]